MIQDNEERRKKAAQLDLKCRKNTNQSDYGLMLNGKHVKSVSKTGDLPNWRFETLQKKNQKGVLMLLFNTTSIFEK